MANVLDVAEFILRQRGAMTAMKLQKLVYYSQAWHLVWESKPLFQERIEAWANGPVSPMLYANQRGQFTVVAGGTRGNAESVTAPERFNIEKVLAFYGDKDPQWLSELTHREAPWKDARAGLTPGERGDREITHAAMAEYYESLT